MPLRAVPLLLGLAAGLAQGQPADGIRFRAQGHDPAWTLSLSGQDLRFESADGLRFVTQTLFDPDPSSGAVALGVEIQGQPALLNGERKLCRDAKSGLPHPWRVSVTFRGRVYLGCGGNPASLLVGAAWQMEALDGAPTLSLGRSQLQFDLDGRASGRAACNRFNARYEIRDGGLRIAGPQAQRMACQPAGLMAEEAALLAFLPEVARFEIDDEGALLLRSLDGRRLRLTRGARPANAPASR